MKNITLALGGGGIKGNAHIGALRVLEREGFNVRAIAGTSAGGLWGSLYAFGYSPDEIQRRISQLDPITIYARQHKDGPAWLGLGGIHKMLSDALGECTFDDLHIPFAVTAVDIDTAEHVVLCDGGVVDAILATIAVPGVFPPKKLDGRTLIDGGLIDPVPVSVARSLAPGLPVVAIVLSPPVDEWGGLTKPQLLNSLPILSDYLARFRITQALNIFMRSLDIGGAMLTELRLQLEKPDVVVRPAVPHIGLLDQVDVAEVAQLGEIATELALPELERAVSWSARLFRRLSRRTVQRVRLPYSSDFPKNESKDRSRDSDDVDDQL